MKVHYDRPKGQRVKKGSIKITINGRKKRINYFNGLTHWVRLSEELLYYVPELDKWITYDKVDELKSPNKKGHILISSSNDKIKNLKSAIRHIKKHDEIPKGTRMRLESRFKGFDIIITK